MDEKWPIEIINFIKQCWLPVPEERPSILELENNFEEVIKLLTSKNLLKEDGVHEEHNT